MLPIVLDPKSCAVGLAGAGEGLARRRALLAQAGVNAVSVPVDVDDEALRGLSVLLVAGLAAEAAGNLASRARRNGVPVNVEDIPGHCDFHVPASVRRGDLLLTVSTGGKAPALARLIREWLDARFGEMWGAHVGEVERARVQWREAGSQPADVMALTRDFVSKRGWLP